MLSAFKYRVEAWKPRGRSVGFRRPGIYSPTDRLRRRPREPWDGLEGGSAGRCAGTVLRDILPAPTSHCGRSRGARQLQTRPIPLHYCAFRHMVMKSGQSGDRLGLLAKHSLHQND